MILFVVQHFKQLLHNQILFWTLKISVLKNFYNLLESNWIMLNGSFYL